MLPPTGNPDGHSDVPFEGHPDTDTSPVTPDAEPRSITVLDIPVEAPDRDGVRDHMLGRLLTRTPAPGLWSWLGPALVTALAALLRLWSLGTPHKLVFDETYYVKDAYTLWRNGYESVWPKDPNAAFEAGNVNTYLNDPSYVVHPQVGKWLIALGENLFGIDSSFGWRFSAAVVGIASVWMIARIARRMFGSNLLGTLAGLFVAVDGMSIVMSRTSILDIFVMFFALAAFGALILDRDQSRRRLADAVAERRALGLPLTKWGPSLGMRWWLLAAGILLGLCIGVKWSGMYFLAAFGLMTVLWDYGARRAVGIKGWILGTTVKDGIVAFLLLVPVAIVTYVASWWSWFASSNAYDRNWAAEHPGQGVTWLPDALRSWWEYHTQMWTFHTGLSTPHTYQSHPIGWLIQWRPTSFFYNGEQTSCGAAKCSQAINSLGNPLIWWGGSIAIIACVVAWLWWRDWRPGAALAGIAAGWLPWFMYPDRTIFTFYSIAFEPFVVLALVYGVGLVMGPRNAHPQRRKIGMAIAWSFVVLVVAAAAFFWPIWSGEVITYDEWRARMWLTSWI